MAFILIDWFDNELAIRKPCDDAILKKETIQIENADNDNDEQTFFLLASTVVFNFFCLVTSHKIEFELNSLFIVLTFSPPHALDYS